MANNEAALGALSTAPSLAYELQTCVRGPLSTGSGFLPLKQPEELQECRTYCRFQPTRNAYDHCSSRQDGAIDNGLITSYYYDQAVSRRSVAGRIPDWQYIKALFTLLTFLHAT